MKRIYVLTHGKYDDETIVGVFDSLVEVDKGKVAYLASEHHYNNFGENDFNIYPIEGINIVGEVFCL